MSRWPACTILLAVAPGTLAIQGTDLLVKRAHLELPGVVSLRRGIGLLPIAEYPADDYPPDDHLGPGHQVIEDPADTDKPWWWSAGSPDLVT